MKEYIMNRVIWALVLLSSLILASCDTYKIKDGKVYFVRCNENSGYSLELIPEADAETFVELDDGFGHDAKHAWYENALLKGIMEPHSIRWDIGMPQTTASCSEQTNRWKVLIHPHSWFIPIILPKTAMTTIGRPNRSMWQIRHPLY